MDFMLGEEERLLCETVAGLCDQRVRPAAGDWDEARALPPELLGELGELGLLALEVPEDDGGAGLSAVAACALCEVLAAADGGLAQLVVAHNHLGLAHVGLSAEARAALVSDGHLVAWALPDFARTPGFEGSLGVTASASGEGWTLEGRVEHVLGAGAAGRIVVFADGEAGPTAWLVEADAKGIERTPVRTLGARAAGTAHLTLSGVAVTEAQRLGEPGAALEDAWALLPRYDLGIAAVACGLSRGVLDVAAPYSLEREQFGRPIARFQAIQWKLADMATNRDAGWLLTLQAAWRSDEGQPFAQAAARARLHATTHATRACSEALQIHGGYGYTREYPVERSLRDARHCEGRSGAGLRLSISQAIAERFGR